MHHPASWSPKQKSSASSAKPLKRPSWSSRLAGAHERHAFEPQLWSSCQAGTRKAEGSAALPSASGTDPRTGRRAPTPETGNLKGEKLFLPGCSVFSLSWPACAGAFLVPGPLVLRPLPHTVPIYVNYTLYLAILRLTGRDLSMFLMMNLLERWYSFTANAEKEIVPVVREKPCYVCLDFGTEHKSLAQADKENVYFLPESYVISVATNVSVVRNCCS